MLQFGASGFRDYCSTVKTNTSLLQSTLVQHHTVTCADWRRRLRRRRRRRRSRMMRRMRKRRMIGRKRRRRRGGKEFLCLA